MRTTAHPTRENRTITVDFQNEATYCQLLGDGKAFLECVFAFLLSLGFQLKHKATCSGGRCLTRHSHYMRVRLGGVTLWRLQCTTCRAVFTILPHFVLRYRSLRPEVARDALLATHGGLSLELCAVICHISPLALYRLVCAFGHPSLVTVLTRCGLPLPTYFLANEKRVRRWFQEKKAGWYAVLADPQMPVTSTLLDQAHNAIERKLFMMKGFHHPKGSQQAFLRGLAHLYNLVPYQRRAKHAGQCGVEVEGGKVPTTDWFLNLQILTSGGFR